ncbi:MAG: STAS domain-containing protein [Planctomycetota bacterium]|jgi:anti-anti-sigma factor|nr:STAS domain-containing protein [Planctomycetota bacterium]
MVEQVRTVDGVSVILVNESDCAGLWRVAEPLLANGAKSFVLDFSTVEYLNSMNIAAIISMRTKLENQGAKLALCGMKDQIASIFRILKLERLFDLSLDCASAVKAVG